MPLPMAQPQPPSRPLADVKQVIAVAAGKGGVGKSSVAVNLALALKQQGYAVGLLDADLYGPSIRKMLPESVPPVQNGTSITPALCSGIKMISMAYFRNEKEAAVIRAPIANGLITQFVQNVDWGKLDVLVVDLPPGTGDIPLTLSQKLPFAGAVMVTTPQEVALIDVRKAMHMFAQVNVPIIGVVENMSDYIHPITGERISIFGKGGGERLAAEWGVPLLGKIPLDPEISHNADKGLSLVDLDPTCQKTTTKAFVQIAKQVMAQLSTAAGPIVRDIKQKDATTFTLYWNAGRVQEFRLSDLQKVCPCAACVDENTGKRVSDPTRVDNNVSANSIRVVGRYGLQIQFTSGCSTGIYSFDLLKGFSQSSI